MDLVVNLKKKNPENIFSQRYWILINETIVSLPCGKGAALLFNTDEW